MHQVQVFVPCNGMPRAVASLVTGEVCAFAAHDGQLTIRIPKLELFEAIKISR